MPIIATTSRGQATFRKEFFQHLGIKPGEKFEVDFLPNGELRCHAIRKTGKIEDFFGCLAGQTNGKSYTIDEMDDAMQKAVADAVIESLKR